MRRTFWILTCLLSSATFSFGQAPTLLENGVAISLDQVIPANERGIVCLRADDKGRIWGGTTGRAAHLFVHDPATGQVKSLARLEGGIGFAHGLVRLPDGSLIGGTQADPTGIAVRTDHKAVGQLYRFLVSGDGPAKVESLGTPVLGQGILTLAHLEQIGVIVGNTWPDGHFFSYDLKTRQFQDHGTIAGYRTFETPRHAEDINRQTDQQVKYPRQVSRAIVVDPATGAWTAGANGLLYRFDPDSRKLEKTTLQLPAVRGREPWASLDAAVVYPRVSRESGEYAAVVGGTSDGYLFELRIFDKSKHQLRPRGKPLAQGTIQGLAAVKHEGPKGSGQGKDAHTVVGVGGYTEGMPRSFAFSHGGSTSAVVPGGIPVVDGQSSMVGFGALIADGKGNVWAGERDRIARLVRYASVADAPAKPVRKPARKDPPPLPQGGEPARLPCHVVFAPQGTTTDGSGYTAIEVGKDGFVYVGSARYGDYGWLLRFDPAAKPTFMDKVVSMQQLTGERLQGINTQGKIHAKIVVGADGRVWFGSKQAHEIFGTRPEYGEEPYGYPGGHLCWFDPKTGFSRSVGILKKQEGLMGGVIDDGRGTLYFKSEPKNHWLVYDIKTGDVQDRGHVGAACRYMAIDKQGAVYTIGRGATVARYDPVSGYLEDLAVKVEGDGTYTPPYVIAIGPNGKLYGAAAGHPSIMEFDVDRYQKGALPTVTMRNVAPAAPPGMPVQDIHAGTFGKDGRFWYPLNTTDPTGKDPRRKAHLRIMRFDPATKRTETVGVPEVIGLDEAKVKHTYNRGMAYGLEHMQGAAVGADGSLYLLDIYPQLNVACFPKLTAPK